MGKNKKIERFDKKKEFVVFGLGRFGASVAETLAINGCQVLAVDKNEDKIQMIADKVTHAVCIDVTDKEAIDSIGIRNFDGAIVSIGSNLEASILVTILAKETGIPYILAKAHNELHAKVLKKVGADAVVFPEKETGIRIAHNMIMGNFFDSIELAADYSLMEFEVPEEWYNSTLRTLNLRAAKKINVIGIKRGEKLRVTIDADEPLEKGDILVIVGKNHALDKLIQEQDKESAKGEQ